MNETVIFCSGNISGPENMSSQTQFYWSHLRHVFLNKWSKVWFLSLKSGLQYSSIFSQFSHFTTPENTRKPLV